MHDLQIVSAPISFPGFSSPVVKAVSFSSARLTTQLHSRGIDGLVRTIDQLLDHCKSQSNYLQLLQQINDWLSKRRFCG